MRPSGVPEDTHPLATPYGTVEVYSRDAAVAVAVAGRYAIQIIRQHGSWRSVSAMRRALGDLAHRYDKFGFVGVIEPEASLLLGSETRQGYEELIRRYSRRFTGGAIVYEKSGFGATAVRSVVTATNVASRASHPNQVFADLREAVAWVSALTAPEPSPAALVHIVQLLRASLRDGG